jgi:hypothetical protein
VFKRLRWIGAGAALGAGGVVWLQARLRRFTPAGLAGEAVGRARSAIDEGRVAMRDREAELRRNHLRPQRSAQRRSPRRGR